MSDPVTNVDIEDVLSSIRKLVSEGEKARTRDSDLAPEPEPTPAPDPESTPGRLVLTADFRVPEDEDETAADANAPAEHAVDEESAWSAEQEPTPAEDDAEEWVDYVEDDGRHDGAAAPDDTDAATAEDAPDADDSAPAESPISRLEETIAELEAAVGQGADEFEPDGSEQDAARPGFDWPFATSTGAADVLKDAPGDEGRPSDAPDTLDAQVAQGEGDAEAVSPAPDPVPEMADVASDPAPRARDAAPETDGLAAIDDDLEDWDDTDTGGLLDDAAMRALVADIVREELQGPLGERITRNVRKLVRREIYRILASQDFD